MLKYLGAEDYGLWVLINSIVMVMTFSNFGLGNALIKLGSECMAQGDEDSNVRFNRLFGVTFTISIVVSVLLMLLITLCGQPVIALFVGDKDVSGIMHMSYLLGGVTVMRVFNSVVAGAYMAKHRYDLNSKVNIATNLISSIVYTILAVYVGDLTVLVITLLVTSMIQVGLNVIIAKKVLPDIRFQLQLERESLRSVISYGFYSWMQALNSTLLTQADKLIIGWQLGLSALGYYTVCSQLVFKIHEIPVVAGSYLLAKFSALYEAGDHKRIKNVYIKAMMVKGAFIIMSVAFLCIFAKQILTLWISPEFAHDHSTFFQMLSIGMAFFALGVIPYYCLNGTGFIRQNTFLAYLTTMVSIGVMPLLIPQFGIYGVAIGKMATLPVMIYLIYFVDRKVVRRDDSGDHQLQRETLLS
jgi:O-antigen/teichoic acid export membrane protein